MTVFSQVRISFTWAHVIFFLSLILWKQNNQTPSRKGSFSPFPQSNKSRIINHVSTCKLDLSDFPMNALSSLPTKKKKKKNPVGNVAIVQQRYLSYISFSI